MFWNWMNINIRFKVDSDFRMVYWSYNHRLLHATKIWWLIVDGFLGRSGSYHRPTERLPLSVPNEWPFRTPIWVSSTSDETRCGPTRRFAADGRGTITRRFGLQLARDAPLWQDDAPAHSTPVPVTLPRRVPGDWNGAPRLPGQTACWFGSRHHFIYYWPMSPTDAFQRYGEEGAKSRPRGGFGGKHVYTPGPYPDTSGCDWYTPKHRAKLCATHGPRLRRVKTVGGRSGRSGFPRLSLPLLV